MMLLDAHTHAFPEEICRHREDYFADEPAFRILYDDPKARLVHPEELVRMLDEEGVEAAVVSGFPWRREALWRRQHEVLLEAQRRWPNKIIALANVNPLDRQAAREVERCLAVGFRGVGELAWYVDDPGGDLEYFLTPLAELAADYGVPLMLHMNDPVGPAYPGKAAIRVDAVYRLIQKFPETPGSWPTGAGGCRFTGSSKRRPPRSTKRFISTPRRHPIFTGRPSTGWPRRWWGRRRSSSGAISRSCPRNAISRKWRRLTSPRIGRR